jgi:hypothetical protein
MNRFELICALNANHEKIRTQAAKVALCLSYMTGPALAEWVDEKVSQLRASIPSTLPDHLQTLWDDFKQDYKDKFADTTKKEDATQKLLNLRMQDWDLDGYITMFRHLMIKADWGESAAGTVRLFRTGLNPKLRNEVIRFSRPLPLTLLDWQNACKERLLVYKEMKSDSALGFKRDSPEWQRMKRSLMHSKGKVRGPDDMDVDLAHAEEVLKAEKRKKAWEGIQCYNCGKKGHISRECKAPRKKGTGEERTQTKARKSRVDSDDEGTIAAQDADSMFSQVKGLSPEEKAKFLDCLTIEEEQDF